MPTNVLDPTDRTPTIAKQATATLRDLLEEGIYLLFLLRDDHAPSSCAEFNTRIDSFFASFDSQARKLGKPEELIRQSQYAFCALMDEIALAPRFPLHSEWARNPLQLRLFGDQLAGNRFFDRLEVLRRNPAANIEALEVFYTCLLLGFHGKYLFEGMEKLGWLIESVGREIRQLRGETPKLAPFWKPMHLFQGYVRHELPMWLYFGLLALVAAGGFAVFRFLLAGQVDRLFGI
jgi:type VI secretion system protein ImpK